MNEQTIKKGHADCLAHSGVCTEILDIKQDTKEMQKLLNSMRAGQIANLVVLIMTLLGVLLNLIFRFEPAVK